MSLADSISNGLGATISKSDDEVLSVDDEDDGREWMLSVMDVSL